MAPAAPGLLRGIRRWDLFLLMVNSTIGAGIFGLPAKVYALIGPWSLPALALCGLVIALVLVCFAEVASRYERTGGPYLYARSAFGALVGFETGWLLWLVRLTSYAALCNLLVSYLAVLWPPANGAGTRVAVIVAVTAALTAINLIGVRRAAVTGNVFTIAKLLPLALVIVAGLFAIAPERLAIGPAPAPANLAKASLLLIFAFAGFELAIIPAGETDDPRAHLPWALLSGLGAVALVYALVMAVCVGAVDGLATSERPVADAAARALGPWGGGLVAVGAVISITGTLGAILLAAPRLTYAMAECGELPRGLASIHPRFHTPWLAILTTAGAMLLLTLGSTFLSALTIGTIIRLVTYVLTCVAMIALRRRADAPAATFRAPGGVVTAALALIACGWLLTSISAREAALAGIAAAIGLGIYALRRGTIAGARA